VVLHDLIGKNADQIASAYVVPAAFKGYMEGRQSDRTRAVEDIKIILDELKRR
jgi:hypothetical protein